jgi:hypothetical protein
MMINDFPTWDHKHTPLVLDPIIHYLNDTIFKPSDKKGVFPSLSQIRKMGKQVVIFASSTYSRLGGEYVHESVSTGFKHYIFILIVLG